VYNDTKQWRKYVFFFKQKTAYEIFT